METNLHLLDGVIAAAVTPIAPDHALAPYDIVPLLEFLARRGCHGALLMGTTGEGPSLSLNERVQLMEAGIVIRQQYPDFRLLAGTGTPSLEDTIQLTRRAFDIGYDGVVVLPPYYFRRATLEGLYAWFHAVLTQAVPANAAFFGYHFPGVSGVPLAAELLLRLRDAFPNRLRGIKDSSGDPKHTRQICAALGTEFKVMVGNDRWFAQGLLDGAAGCITALANLDSPELRQVWEAWQSSRQEPVAQQRIEAWRLLLDRNQPAPPYVKALLSRLFGFPNWQSKPPLLALSEQQAETAAVEFETILHGSNA